MNTKYIHELKIGDKVRAHGGTFLIVENAKPSLSHHTREWVNGNNKYYPEAPDCAYANSICIEGEVKGYFRKGTEWLFQGNFLAGKFTLVD